MKKLISAMFFAVLASAAAMADATIDGVTYVDLTTDGAGTASSTNAAYYGYSMPGCFDNSWADSADRGMCGYTTTYPAMYVDYAFNTATAVNAYSVRNAGNGGANQTERAPNTWTFEGSDDGTTWTVLDARSGEDNWANAEIRLYKFDNSHAYTHYRYSCTALNGRTDCFQVHEIEFYNTTAPLVTSSFSKKLVFTVAGHAGSEDLKHFPVLVRLSTAINGFDYADCGTGGAGLRFADADGNLLHHEIDTWNTAGESLVWVDLPHCRANETFTLYLAADDPAALQTVYPTEVWDNAGIPAVWHMNEVKVDSSGHSYTYYNCGTLGTITTGGAVGKQYDGTAGGGWSIADNRAWSGYGAGGKVAYTAWVSRNAADSGTERYVFSTDNISLTSTSTATSYTWKLYNGTTVLLTVTTDADLANWSQVAVVSGSGAIKLYFNGELAGTYAGNIPASPNAFRIGAKNTNGDYRWKSYLDEVRIHRAEESTEYVRASYATVASAGFLTNTGVQSTGAVSPLAVRADEATLSGTTATITGRLSNLGTGATSADVTLYYGTTPDIENGTAGGTTNLTEAADLSDTLAGLTAGVTYYYAYKAVNNLSATAWSATNSFTVEDATEFSDTIAIATQNCRLTVTGTMTHWGLGTTAVELLVGTSADNLVSVQTVNLSAAPANMEVAFDPVTEPIGTYYVAIRATTTYNDIVWVRETAATSQALADTSTYTWKGGTGSWSDASMWTSSDTGAGGYPTDGCTVVIPAADSDIVLSANLTLAGLTISSEGKHVFCTAGASKNYKLTVSNNNAKLAGAGGGTLVVDNIVIDSKVTDLAGLKQLAIAGSGRVFPANSETTEILLVNGGCVYAGWENKTFGKLILQGGPGRIECGNYTFSFASLETRRGSGVSAAYVGNGKVSFRDPSGVEMVGGTHTLDNPGPQIPVCTQFLIASGNKDQRYGKSLCTIDADGVVREIPQSSMLTSFDGATALDNVCIASDTTLDADVTVNAVVFSGASCDLSEHTVTVKSGQFREGSSELFGKTVSNGTVRLCKPNVLADSTNNADVRMQVDFATEGVDDMLTPMVSHEALNSGWAYKADYAGFTGVFSIPRGQKYYLRSDSAPKAVLELRNGTLTSGSAGVKGNFGGLAGDGEVNFNYNGADKWNNNIWLGEMSDDDVALVTNGTVNCSVMVGNKGVFAPGLVGYDGGRRGSIRMPYMEHAFDTFMLSAFLMQEGGTFMASLNADGTCGYLDASDTKTAGKYLSVSLDGALSVTTAGRVANGVPYPIIKYHEGQLSGRFANVTQGFKVQYDVAQPDGSYAVTVTKKGNAGTVIIFR